MRMFLATEVPARLKTQKLSFAGKLGLVLQHRQHIFWKEEKNWKVILRGSTLKPGFDS